MTITPKWTLADIYGTEWVFNPRNTYEEFGWIPCEDDFNDFRTGALLSIAGNMPMIAHKQVVTEQSLQLMALAGIHSPPNLLIYDTKKAMKDRIDSLIQSGKKQVVNQIYPEGEIPAKGYWIDPKLLTYLNNKASLSELVPEGHYPRRTAVETDELDMVKKEWALPLVLKTATNLPNAGGYDVAICQTEEDLDKAWEDFKDSEQIVVEELVEIERNYCVQFARTYQGEILCLGAAEQITSDEGNYEGNWLNDCDQPPQEVMDLGEKIMENAAKRGYVGVGGFDILTTKDGRIVCIDLNFRLNGSTPALLLKDKIMEASGKEHLLFRTWEVEQPWEEFEAKCEELIKSGSLFPLSIYQPEQDGTPGEKLRTSAILAGDSKAELLQIQKQLHSLGWR